MDTAKTVGMDAAKTASKRVVQKTAEAIGDLIGNKIADKITSAGKPKNKGKKEVMKQIKGKKSAYHQESVSKLLTVQSLCPLFSSNFYFFTK